MTNDKVVGFTTVSHIDKIAERNFTEFMEVYKSSHVEDIDNFRKKINGLNIILKHLMKD